MPAMRFNPVLQFLDLDRMARRLFIDFHRDEHPVERILFRPETRIHIQPLQSANRSLEQ